MHHSLFPDSCPTDAPCGRCERPDPSGNVMSGPHPAWQQPPVLRVRFTDPQEFAAELREREPDVERAVRVTFRWRRDPDSLPCLHLSLVAGYLHAAHQGVLVLVELVHYAGEVWDGLNEAASARARERADQVRQIVLRAAEEVGATVAAGAYCVPGDPGVPGTHRTRDIRAAAA